METGVWRPEKKEIGYGKAEARGRKKKSRLEMGGKEKRSGRREKVRRTPSEETRNQKPDTPKVGPETGDGKRETGVRRPE